jgi:hypothetical protein
MKPVRVAFLLILALCALPGFSDDGSPKPRIAVVRLSNDTGTPSYDAVCGAVTETVDLTLRLLGSFDVRRVDSLNGPNATAAGIGAWAAKNGADSVVFGRAYNDPAGNLALQLSLFDRKSGKVTLQREAKPESVLAVFDASDELIVSFLQSLAGVHLGFGSIDLNNGGEKGSYEVAVDGNPIGTNLTSVDKVLNGRHTVTISQRRMLGTRTIATRTLDVRENESLSFDFSIPLIMNDETAALAAIRSDIIAKWDSPSDAEAIERDLIDYESRLTDTTYSPRLSERRGEVTQLRGEWLIRQNLTQIEENAWNPSSALMEPMQTLSSSLSDSLSSVTARRATIAVDGYPSDWGNIPALTSSPIMGFSENEPGSRASAVYIARDDNFLYWRMDLANGGRNAKYRYELLFGQGGVMTDQVFEVRYSADPSGNWGETLYSMDSNDVLETVYAPEATAAFGQSAVFGNCIEGRIPIASLAGKSLPFAWGAIYFNDGDAGIVGQSEHVMVNLGLSGSASSVQLSYPDPDRIRAGLRRNATFLRSLLDLSGDYKLSQKSYQAGLDTLMDTDGLDDFLDADEVSSHNSLRGDLDFQIYTHDLKMRRWTAFWPVSSIVLGSGLAAGSAVIFILRPDAKLVSQADKLYADYEAATDAQTIKSLHNQIQDKYDTANYYRYGEWGGAGGGAALLLLGTWALGPGHPDAVLSRWVNTHFRARMAAARKFYSSRNPASLEPLLKAAEPSRSDAIPSGGSAPAMPPLYASASAFSARDLVALSWSPEEAPDVEPAVNPVFLGKLAPTVRLSGGFSYGTEILRVAGSRYPVAGPCLVIGGENDALVHEFFAMVPDSSTLGFGYGFGFGRIMPKAFFQMNFSPAGQKQIPVAGILVDVFF